MNIEQLKKLSNMYILHAQALMNINGYVIPIIFIIDQYDQIKPCTMTLETNKDEQALLDLLKQFSKTAKALILVIDTYALDSNEGKPKKIAGNPKAMNILNCFIYMKNIGLIHQISYIHQDNRYTFHDMGWSTLDKNYGNYKNPYDTT